MKGWQRSLLCIREILFVSVFVLVMACTSLYFVFEEQSSETVLTQTYEEGVVTDDEDLVFTKDIMYLSSKKIGIEDVSEEFESNLVSNENLSNIENDVVSNDEFSSTESDIVSNDEDSLKIQNDVLETLDSVPTEYERVIEAKATAYCLCKKCCGKVPGDKYYGVTRSGIKIIPGTQMKVIAVDTSVIPLGSKVYVEGLNGAKDYGYAVAADTGSAIKNKKIDLYFDSHEDCLIWGVKNVKVYLLP